MKKSVLAIIISVLMVIAVLIWMGSARQVNLKEILQSVVVFLLAAFALLMAYRRIKSSRRGQPAEDEYSRKIVQKAAALSYYISLYMWLLISYLGDRTSEPHDVMFGYGIVGMAVVFALSWLYYNFRGIRNE